MTTIGDLNANDIGKTRFTIQHAGSTVSGLLMGLGVDAESMEQQRSCKRDAEPVISRVYVTLTLGSITIGPLDRAYPIEVIA